MKRFLYLSMMAVAMFVMASCSSADTPGKALKQYMEAAKDGNYEKFVDGIAFEDGLSNEKIKEQKQVWISLLKEKGDKEFEKKGGLKDIEIISEEIAEDGNSAVVKFKQTFGNGEVDEDTQAMVKKDGKWLMDINK